ncbi:MAG: alpha/beta hydrolase-fold protein [Candidatus Eisenbacteria bacterium]|nr:alpha/beta hydrolase-fold protein [Candidatus Eisenbacteria bacterium]
MTSDSSAGIRLLALVVAAVLAFPVGVCARDAMVTFKVLVPEDTPPDASVFIAGSIPSLGPWDPGKVKLGKIGDLSYAITLMLPAGLEFRYKFTRGSWETVEKGRWSEEIPDREHNVLGDETVMIHILNWRDYSGEREIYTVVGDVRHHEDFPSTVLGNARSVLVYLPPGYEESEERRYPVLYMHDGQNLFDAATSFIGVEWGVDETMERMIGDGLVEPLIVVGISNTDDREFEYTPAQDPGRGKGGGASSYADFIVDELKPYIDATYRTRSEREYTGIMGSSLGGIASLYIAWTHPDVFSRVGAMSTSYWWSNSQILRMLEETSPPPGVKVWLDMGTAEDESDRNGDDVPDVIEQHRHARNILMDKGLTIPRRLRYIEDEGAVHNERAWAARFPRAVEFLFPAR